MPIELHATYLSMYTELSIIIFLYSLLNTGSARNKLLYALSILVLSAGMLQLSSRAACLALLFILTFIFPLAVRPIKKRLLLFGIMLMLSAGSLFAVYEVDAFKTRYITELKDDLGQHSVNSENTEPRIGRWKIALELARKSPVFGYGSGSEKNLLKEKYFEQKLFISYLNEFNCHSEYLSILLKYGIAGLGWFCFLLYFNTREATRNQDLLYGSFLAIIAIVSLSENILDVNKGIFFYSFFISFFLIGHFKKKKASDFEKATPAH